MLGVPSANILPKLMETPKHLCTAARREHYTILQCIERHLPSSLRTPRRSTRVTHADFFVTIHKTANLSYKTLSNVRPMIDFPRITAWPPSVHLWGVFVALRPQWFAHAKYLVGNRMTPGFQWNGRVYFDRSIRQNKMIRIANPLMLEVPSKINIDCIGNRVARSCT